jgi:urease accessory protein
MEAAVTAGYVNSVADVRDFCLGRLRTAGRIGAAFAATACTYWLDGASAEQWAELDAELSARTPSEATRVASRALGSGLRRLLVATIPANAAELAVHWRLCPSPAPHQPLVLGAGIAMAGGDPAMAARAAALGLCTASASAAVRLLGLDPYRTHTVVADLSDDIEALVSDSSRLQSLAELPADSAPALDLLADVHAQMEVRLFAS